MDVQQRNITLGTAGHIDHGKTALITLLTGCDTDRLKIEKERGMSIELGFAPCTIAGTEIGIVDVPGHENFIKTMVAGATGIDGVILVIAADDGVMPQTREHMDILTLLGVEHGIVVLTKVDCVSADRVQTVTEQVKEFMVGTFLNRAPIFPISNITGEGFDAFYEGLNELVAAIPSRRVEGIFRVPLERSFSAKGYGTIVAGIPVSGSIEIGDEVMLLPQEKKGRIRAVQVYGHESSSAMAGQCAALNVPQWDHKEIERGDVVTIADYFATQQWYLCELKLLERERAELKNASQVKFHTGTSEAAGVVYLFQETNLKPGQKCLIQVRLNEPIVAGPRDHFILRSPSPARTIGGGIIVEGIARRLKRSHPEVIRDIQERAKAAATPKDFVEYCVKSAESLAADDKQISQRSKVPPEQLAGLLTELVNEERIIQLVAKLYTHTDTAAHIQKNLIEIISQFHKKQPESPGIAREQFLIESGIRKDIFDELVKLMLSNSTLTDRKGRLALPEHREQFGDLESDLLKKIDMLFHDRPFNPPELQEIIDGTGATMPDVTKSLRILVEQQRLVRIDQKLMFHADAVAQARERVVSHIQKDGMLESVKFKYMINTTRKYAIPLLDYFDKIGVTRRVGYTRYLGKAAK